MDLSGTSDIECGTSDTESAVLSSLVFKDGRIYNHTQVGHT